MFLENLQPLMPIFKCTHVGDRLIESLDIWMEMWTKGNETKRKSAGGIISCFPREMHPFFRIFCCSSETHETFQNLSHLTASFIKGNRTFLLRITWDLTRSWLVELRMTMSRLQTWTNGKTKPHISALLEFELWNLIYHRFLSSQLGASFNSESILV